MKLLFSAILLGTLFLSCGKDETSAGESSVYFNSNTGSNWTYQPSTGSAYTITATSRDTTALGVNYKVFSSTDGQNRYRAKVGSEYFQFLVVPQILPNGVNELYLKDNLPVGATWSLSQSVTVPNIPIPVTVTLGYTIRTKDTTMTINNNVFTKVIKVGQDITVQGFGNIGSGTFFYADKVGLIKSDVTVTIPGQAATSVSENIVRYELR